MDLSPETKKCNKCREVRSIDYFPPKLDGSGNMVCEYDTWCVDCIVNYRSKYGGNKFRKTSNNFRKHIRSMSGKMFELRAGKNEARGLLSKPTELDLELRVLLLKEDWHTIFKYVVASEFDRVILDAYVPLKVRDSIVGIGFLYGDPSKRVNNICEENGIRIHYSNGRTGLAGFMADVNKGGYVGKKTKMFLNE